MLHITVGRLALRGMGGDVEVARHAVDLERGIDAATGVIVLRSLQGVVDESHLVATKIILNIDAHICKREGARCENRPIRFRSH